MVVVHLVLLMFWDGGVESFSRSRIAEVEEGQSEWTWCSLHCEAEVCALRQRNNDETETSLGIIDFSWDIINNIPDIGIETSTDPTKYAELRWTT